MPRNKKLADEDVELVEDAARYLAAVALYDAENETSFEEEVETLARKYLTLAVQIKGHRGMVEDLAQRSKTCLSESGNLLEEPYDDPDGEGDDDDE